MGTKLINPDTAREWNEFLSWKSKTKKKIINLNSQKLRSERKEKEPVKEKKRKRNSISLERLIERQKKKPNKDRQNLIDKMMGKKPIKFKREIINSFYNSREWQALRYEAIRKYGRICMCCKETNGQMHVDHIKPRSKYPELSLDIRNLQILCRACNMGKSNIDETDWR